MTHPTIFSADAGQAYEVVSESLINTTLAVIFRAVPKNCGIGDPTVSVLHSAKANVLFGGRADDPLKDRTVFFVSKVQKCVLALLQ
jgi:hypothetical protein